MPVLARIQAFLARTGMSQTRFGRLVTNDPRLVSDLRNGRRLHAATAHRIETWLDAQEPAR